MKFIFTAKYRLLFVLLFAFGSNVFSQTASINNVAYGHSSDYYVQVNWYGIGTAHFDCDYDGKAVYVGTSVGNGSYANVNNPPLPDGNTIITVGPNVYHHYYLQIHQWGRGHNYLGTCYDDGISYNKSHDNSNLNWPNGFNVTTDYIHAPANLTATVVNGPNNVQLIKLTWSKGSDIPDGNDLAYKVYRGNLYLGTVSSTSPLTFTDNTLLNTGSYQYSVSSYTTSWGTQESKSYAYGYISNSLLLASDAAYYGKTRLTWPNIASFAPNDIQIMRDSQQIAIVDKNSTAYNDFDGVPGVVYNYSIAPINSNNQTPFAFTDLGNSRPNGVLQGYVRSLLGTGVQGVTLTATGTVGTRTYTYTGITDASGFYKIRDIFYDTLATYTVVASKDSDLFSPPSISRSLDIQNYNNSLSDIYDTTVFTVRGKATFAGTTGCPLMGAKIYVNNAYTGISTDAAGNYSFIAQQPGNYTVSLRYLNHTFDSTTRSVFVSGNTTGIDFHDTKLDTLYIDLRGGCNNQIVDSAHFLVISDPTGSGAGCFSHTYFYNGFDPVVLVLPAQKYRVSVDAAFDPLIDLNIIHAVNSMDPDLSKRDTFDLTSIDTVPHPHPAYNDTIGTLPGGHIIHHNADTTYTVDTVTSRAIPYHSARFVYHGPLNISLTNVDSICNGLVVEQGVKIPMGIYVREQSTYHTTVTSCLQDTGTIRIFDDVSGAGLSYQSLVHGKVLYSLIAGQPNVPDASITHRYQKLFNVFIAAAGAPPANLDAWMTITGDKTQSATFVSKTPPMPLMVLHDPPGSNSYTSWERDSSFSLNVSNYVDNSQNNGGYVGIEVGKVFEVPLTGLKIPGAYFNTQISGSDGHDRNGASATTINFTSTQTIATSSDPQFVGKNADVFIGGTVNTKYAVAYKLALQGCQVKVDTILIWGLDSVTSQFIYTASHIKGTLLVQLKELKRLAPDTMKDYFQNQINMWKQVLTNDSIAIARSNYTSNISFSAGVSYDYTVQQDSTFENSYTYANTHDVSFSIGAGISDADLLDINAGYNLEVHTETGGSSTSDLQKTTTFAYHLGDDVLGNFYSVDIGKDRNFGSPIFKIFAGTSACPHEEGTQFRDAPTMSIAPGSLYNVPANQPAAFVAHIGNQSESNETRTYNIQVDPSTNLDGAIVKIGGQDITQVPASFTIAAGRSIDVALSVQKGAFADYYNDMAIIISSPCDGNISVTVPITVHFQSECSDVGLALPTNNWLANGSNHDTLIVAFSNYNSSNPNLREIGLQYRVSGSTQSWISGPAIPVTALTAPYHTIPFNITNLPDGNYEIRAYAKCLSPAPANILSYTYSPVLSGVIDRRGFSLFGTPQPANGILNRGDNISLQFNEGIDCNELYGRIVTTLRRADNNAIIPDTFVCNGSSLILKTKPDSLIESLNGVEVIATVSNVYDANGNGLNTPISWSFVVNRAQVYWNPSNMNMTNTMGTTSSAIGTLINTATTTQGFTLSTPRWLSPSITSDSISPNGIDSIRFTYIGSLNPGTYYDTIIATVGGLQAKLFVKLDVVKPQPNWSVNAANFQYSMNVTANYSLTSLNTPLSTDKRDMIAIFKGDECRGVANITYDASSARYVAFITAYSNSLVGDSFTFRMWDAMPGTEYQAVEKLPFINDGIIGQAFSPYILHPGGVFQTLTFNPGWNWFSLDVRAADMSVSNVLSHLHPNNGSIVKTINQYSQYSASGSQWQGTLNTFSNANSYMIQLDHADTVHLLGQFIKDTTIMQVAPGWNWIGYPRVNISDAASYLANTNPANGDLLKTQSQFTQYSNGTWSGNLNNLYPGQGYKLKATNAFNFVVAPDRSLPSWSVDENMFQQNQSITADLQFNGVSTSQSHYIVGAFANGICVAQAQPLYLASTGLYRVFITLHGDTANTGQPITFKVYDTDNGVELMPIYAPINVVPDSSIAIADAPYVINVQTAAGINAINYTEGYGLLQNVPNPFSKSTMIEYVVPSAQKVSIMVYDEAGRLVRELVNGTQQAGKHQINVDQENLQSGIYYYQMKSGEFSKTRRMVIMR